MIQVMAEKVTQYIFELQVESQSFENHKYGMEVILSTLIDLGLILIIGLIANHFIDAIIYYLSFWIIRKFSGGFHFQTYLKCICSHVALFAIFIVTYSYYESVMICVQIFALVTFIALSPIRNRQISNKEYINYKVLSLCILLMLIYLSYCTYYANIITYVIGIVSLLLIACINKYETKNI